MRMWIAVIAAVIALGAGQAWPCDGKNKKKSQDVRVSTNGGSIVVTSPDDATRLVTQELRLGDDRVIAIGRGADGADAPRVFRFAPQGGAVQAKVQGVPAAGFMKVRGPAALGVGGGQGGARVFGLAHGQPGADDAPTVLELKSGSMPNNVIGLGGGKGGFLASKVSVNEDSGCKCCCCACCGAKTDGAKAVVIEKSRARAPAARGAARGRALFVAPAATPAPTFWGDEEPSRAKAPDALRRYSGVGVPSAPGAKAAQDAELLQLLKELSEEVSALRKEVNAVRAKVNTVL